METPSPEPRTRRVLPIELKEKDIVDRGRFGKIKISGSPVDTSFQDPASGCWKTRPAWPFRGLNEELREDGTVGTIAFDARKKVRVVDIQTQQTPPPETREERARRIASELFMEDFGLGDAEEDRATCKDIEREAQRLLDDPNF